ncbi:hypothetical protein OB13_17425 [Pontibacter sp. HJ8]
MSNQDYIASGILEVYAAGGLTQAEREEVEQHAAASPEVRAALEEACAALEAYARLHAVAPRADLRNRILSRIGEEETQVPVAEREPQVVPLYPETQREASPYKWMFAASVALFLISGFLSFLFYNKWQQAEERLQLAVASEQRLAQNLSTVSLQSEQQQEALTIIRDADFKSVRLQGVEAHPEANVLVYWNPQRRQVYVDRINLPAPPAGKQYQLWALDKGKPVDAGMIALNGQTDVLQQMKAIGSAQAFAVTLEPAGGSENPTLEQLMVMGEVSL